MRNAVIAVIDSGMLPQSYASSCVIGSFALSKNETEWEILESPMKDYIGHGTAVSNIIWNINPNVNIVVFRICNDVLNVDEFGLVKVLEFIYANIDVDIINISAGVTYLYDYNAINDICLKLSKKGVIIISAFDNDGAISYPAALECVVGVDVKNIKKNEIIFIENGISNIVLSDKYYRTEWLNTKTIIKGTSFACAHISGLLSLKINSHLSTSEMIYSIATKFERKSNHEIFLKPQFHIHRAIVFPINKESHALLRFKDKLNFEIVSLYDERLSGKVGKSMFGEIIKSYDDIDWLENFDTIILSCVSELERLTKRDYVQEIVSNAKSFGKNIYSFEPLPFYDESMFYPNIGKNNVPIQNEMKLHKITIPIVEVVGTSSKQGKFTMQQKIIHQLSQMGYNVGSIITEPSGYLFNADYVFHFGYHANLDLYPSEYIAILNEMLFEVQKKKKIY